MFSPSHRPGDNLPGFRVSSSHFFTLSSAHVEETVISGINSASSSQGPSYISFVPLFAVLPANPLSSFRIQASLHTGLLLSSISSLKKLLTPPKSYKDVVVI